MESECLKQDVPERREIKELPWNDIPAQRLWVELQGTSFKGVLIS